MHMPIRGIIISYIRLVLENLKKNTYTEKIILYMSLSF